MLNLDDAIRSRHSTRMFLPQKPVPRELLDEALALAQCAPSNSNIQPWHMYFVSGARRDRLVSALTEEAKRRPPNIPPLPASLQHFRNELGKQVFGAMGIGPQDTEKHTAAVMRNWEFFRAPIASVVCMHRDLSPWDAMTVGMFLQTLLLALTEREIGSCVEVSVVGYPEILRAELNIPDELSILCGLAIGYADPDFAANKLTISREPIREYAVFLESLSGEGLQQIDSQREV